MGIDPVNDFSISFDLNTDVQSEQDILNLPQKIAEAKKKQIIICIDEFQQITEFNNALSFQKKLRSRWQLQQNVTYCLFGSKMHIMSDLFSKQSKPFYKFGDVLFLQKISEKDWVEFLVSRFTATGKSIPNEIALKICKSVENHSSYVQQLAWLVWNNTEKKANEDNLKIALRDLIDQNSPIFYGIVENLTGFQLNFIRALLDGMESEFTRSEILKKYNLGTSANISRIKKSLEQKEIIDITGKKVTLLDPVFKLWLKRELW
jgi:hypothetical protein